LNNEKCHHLIIGPHPDDEALGCAGLIYKALKKNEKVKVIVVANGESSIEGTKWFYGRKPTTEDFINIGYMRQKETIAAMKVLGLKSNDIKFLGYPNDGLLEIISSDKYTPNNPFKSQFTGFERVSYENSFNIGVPFCKNSLFTDFRDLLKKYDPDHVYVTHPLDSHNDHKACGRFVYDLSKEFRNSIKVRCYVIAKSKIPSKKHRMIYKSIGQLKESHLDEVTKKIKKRCMGEYKSQGFLFDEIAFHYDVERLIKLEHGLLAKIAKKLRPSLVY
jgi:LmbE family N-acetylglucosaminyl deacetylase